MRVKSIHGLALAAALLMSSCVGTEKFTYFQGGNSAVYPTYIETPPAPVSKISPDDVLAITVSSLNDQSNEILNFANVNALQMSTFAGGGGGAVGSRQPLGYRVDSTGTVVVPFIGKQYVVGMTLLEAGEKIKTEVEKYLRDPAVNVRFLNHKYSVMGEVNKVGTFNLLDDRTTLPEALATAGDLTIYGNRQEVTIIRDVKGIREIGKVNLLSREIFQSPYFYIHNGDVIYIEPIKGRVTSTEQKVQLVPIFASVATALAVYLNLILK